MRTIKALLEGYGQVLEATDGPSGIEMALVHQPNLILMDIALPGMNGIETMQEIRKSEFLKHTPVVAVSASAMKGDREHFLACGFNDYISKPIDHEILDRTITKTIGPKRHLP
jgi:CheY-like chemotaxis protein